MENGSVWERVRPTLNPWPGADAVGKALEGGAKAEGAVLASKAGAKRLEPAPDRAVSNAARITDAAPYAPRSPRVMPDTTRKSQVMPDTTRKSQVMADTTRKPEIMPSAARITDAAPDRARNMSAARSSDAAQGEARRTETPSDTARSLAPTQSPELTAADVEILPGAEPNPCCMGTEAVSDLAVLTGFLEDERAERRQLQTLARQSPTWARQTVLTLAAHAVARARRLSAAHYLIAGESYLPAIATEKIYVGKWRPALRERYHSAACAAMNYDRAADGTPDPCLGALFRELGADAFECADVLMRLLERSLV